MTLAAHDRFGHFEIVTALGAGGMGEVYRALDTRLGREVALKVLPESTANDGERLARLRREAQLLAQLNHPRIAAIYGLEEADGRLALVLELVPGPTLEAVLRSGPIDVRDALAIARDLAEALAYAHDRGIVHRDLKPANVKVDDAHAKVLDFGLARALEPTDPRAGPLLSHSPTLSLAATEAGTILGTAAYMSPEQARGRAVDRRADVWAFGVVLYEMLSGRRLFQGETVSDMLAAVLRQEVDWTLLPADTPPSVRRLLGRCLERAADNRLRDLGDARHELDAASAELSSAQTLVPGGTRTPSVDRRRPRWPWAVATLAIGTVGGAFAARTLWHSPEAARQPLRLSIPLPASVEDVRELAIAPREDRLALTTLDSDGSRRLAVLDLASGSLRALPGTTDAARPFWSPDGRFIAYFANGKLARVPADGGPPQTLVLFPYDGGGTWGDDGAILLGSWNGKPLMRLVPGGALAPVTRLSTEARWTQHMWPRLLPDGKHALFLDDANVADDHALRVAALDGTPGEILTARASSGATYASGHLVYVEEGALTVRPFDARARRFSGEPRSLDSPIRWLDAHNYTLAASPRLVVYMVLDPAQRLRWVDRHGATLGEVGSPADNVEFTLSPDDRSVVMERLEPGRRDGDLWQLDLERNVELRLTQTSTWESRPVWSPDGRQVAYTRHDPDFYSLHTLDVARRVETGSWKVQDLDSASDWSPDGGAFALEIDAAETGGDVATLPLAVGAAPQVVAGTAAWENSARWSPDGRYLAYVSSETGIDQVYLQPFPTTGERVQVSRDGGFAPTWRRAGGELYFSTLDGRMTAVDVSTSPKLVVGVPHTLFRLPLSDFQNRVAYAVTADGSRFLVNPAKPLPRELTVIVDWANAAR